VKEIQVDKNRRRRRGFFKGEEIEKVGQPIFTKKD